MHGRLTSVNVGPGHDHMAWPGGHERDLEAPGRGPDRGLGREPARRRPGQPHRPRRPSGVPVVLALPAVAPNGLSRWAWAAGMMRRTARRRWNLSFCWT